MEWLLLLLLGSLAAGTVYWTASSRPSTPEKREPDGDGPRSSPELPERRERAPVVDVKASDVEKLRDFLSKAPDTIAPDVVETKDKSAREAAEDLRKEIQRKKKPLKVSFSTDQIIPRSSPHAFHRRPLQSAEQFVEQQLAEEALHLYERVDRRIDNEEINRKIRTNIEDIRRWMEGLDGDEDEPITFPEIIIPLTSQALALESLSEGLRKISESLSQDIVNALRQQEPGTPQAAQPGMPQAPQPGTPQAPRPDMPQATQPDMPQAPRPDMPQATQPGMPQAPQPDMPQAPQPGTPQAPSARRRLYVAPPPVSLPGDPDEGVPGITIYPQAPPVGPGVTTGPADYFRHARDEFKFDEQGRLITDGRTDEDFEEQWKKYSQLPLTDRRSGEERRRPEDDADDRIDRRSHEDRRKADLFKERDEFLQSWKRHEDRKKLLEQRSISPLPDLDVFVSPFPYQDTSPPVEPVGLPEADMHPLDGALEEAHSLVDQIHSETSSGAAPAPEDLPALELPEADYDSPSVSDSAVESRTEIVPPALDPLQLPEADDLPAQPPPLEKEADRTEEAASKVELVQPPPVPLNLPDAETITEPLPAPGVSGGPAEGMPETAEKPGPEDEPLPVDAEAKTHEESFGEGVEAADIPEMPELPEERGPVQEIRGVLELKPPDEDDAPFLTLTYDFSKIPDSFKLSRDYHTMEFVYYKYKPMLIKAQEFARRKMLKSALNYYRVIKSQNIPPEFRRMVNRNIQDITDYLEKFMMSRSGD